MTVQAFRAHARRALQAANNPDAAWDADALLMDVLCCERGQLTLRGEDPLSPDQENALNERLSRRLSGEPLAYVLGYTYFMGLRFACDMRALIPRQDTETLAEEAIARLSAYDKPRMLDVCCGTGCIGLSCARLAKKPVELTLSDLSEGALSLARENARALGVEARLCQGDLFAPVGGLFDLIACNPPYLTGEDMENLQSEVRREPELALYGGGDGLAFYRRLAKEAPAYLAPGASLLAEVGMGQAGDVSALFAETMTDVTVLSDLRGVGRVVCARRIP